MYSIHSSGLRLSPLNISDPLLRAELFREIRLAQQDRKYRGKEWAYYDIQPADVKSPELIAWKVYSLDTLKWLIMAAACLDNPRDLLEAGMRIYLSSTRWHRERILASLNTVLRGQNNLQAASDSRKSVISNAVADADPLMGISGVMKIGADFEAAMSKVAAISGATGQELTKLTKQARQLGATTE